MLKLLVLQVAAFQKVAMYSHPCVKFNTRERETITLQIFLWGV